MSNKDYPYPDDEFDAAGASRVPKGVHREPVPRWKQWMPYLLVLVLVPLLTVVFVKFFATPPGSETPEASPTQTVAPPVDDAEGDAQGDPDADADGGGEGDADGDTDGAPAEELSDPSDGQGDANAAPDLARNVHVLVLNGARVPGLAGDVTGLLESEGWTNTEADNHTGDLPIDTTLYYTSAEFEAEARAVAEQLGIENVSEDASSASNGIVIVLRPGFVLPG